MKLFVFKLTLALALLLTTFVFYLDVPGMVRNYALIKWHEQSDVEFVNEELPDYDVVVLGSSHALAIGASIKKHYNLKVKSIARLGGGLLIQKRLLKNFISTEIRAKHLIYFVDPFVLCSDKFDNLSFDKPREFNLGEFWQNSLNFGIKTTYNNYYNEYEVLSKNQVLQTRVPKRTFLTEISQEAVMRRIDDLCPPQSSQTANQFEEQKRKLKDLLDVIQASGHYATKSIIIPPTLFGVNEPYHNDLEEMLVSLIDTSKISIYNYSDCYLNSNQLHYFNNRDYDHLNYHGAFNFNKDYIIPLLNVKSDQNIYEQIEGEIEFVTQRIIRELSNDTSLRDSLYSVDAEINLIQKEIDFANKNFQYLYTKSLIKDNLSELSIVDKQEKRLNLNAKIDSLKKLIMKFDNADYFLLLQRDLSAFNKRLELFNNDEVLQGLIKQRESLKKQIAKVGNAKEVRNLRIQRRKVTQRISNIKIEGHDFYYTIKRRNELGRQVSEYKKENIQSLVESRSKWINDRNEFDSIGNRHELIQKHENLNKELLRTEEGAIFVSQDSILRNLKRKRAELLFKIELDEEKKGIRDLRDKRGYLIESLDYNCFEVPK